MILILRLKLKKIQIRIQHLLPIRGLNGLKISLKQSGIVLVIEMIEEERGPSIRMNILHSPIQIHLS